MKCLQESKCVGYNYRSNSNKYAASCELSNKTQERGGKTDSDGNHGGWIFYQNLETVSIDSEL